MHMPDGFINGATAAGGAVVAVSGLGVALRASANNLKDKQIPLAGLAAAFIFALQMLNFPVAAGTSGHLLGGALAAILLGPALGITVVSVVVIVQALLFADGGITVLGLSVINMAIITTLVAWALFHAIMKFLPKRTPSALAATMVAAWASVVASSFGFVLQYAIGGQGGVDIGTVFGAMVGVHALIGIGEGLITTAVVGAVLAVRPDLVAGAARYDLVPSTQTSPSKRATWGFVVAGLLAAFVLVAFVAPIASPNPDGLEKVAEDTGFIETAEDHAIGGPLAEYGVSGVDDERVGTIVAGVIGIVVCFGVGLVLVSVFRRRQAQKEPASA